MTNQAERDRHRREYQRIVEELQALAARANMSAAIIMTEFEDGVPRLEDVGLESLRRLLAPLGYAVEKMADLSPVAVAYGALRSIRARMSASGSRIGSGSSTG